MMFELLDCVCVCVCARACMHTRIYEVQCIFNLVILPKVHTHARTHTHTHTYKEKNLLLYK
jgi:hypothetical protein